MISSDSARNMAFRSFNQPCNSSERFGFVQDFDRGEQPREYGDIIHIFRMGAGKYV